MAATKPYEAKHDVEVTDRPLIYGDLMLNNREWTPITAEQAEACKLLQNVKVRARKAPAKRAEESDAKADGNAG